MLPPPPSLTHFEFEPAGCTNAGMHDAAAAVETQQPPPIRVALALDSRLVRVQAWMDVGTHDRDTGERRGFRLESDYLRQDNMQWQSQPLLNWSDRSQEFPAAAPARKRALSDCTATVPLSKRSKPSRSTAMRPLQDIRNAPVPRLLPVLPAFRPSRKDPQQAGEPQHSHASIDLTQASTTPPPASQASTSQATPHAQPMKIEPAFEPRVDQAAAPSAPASVPRASELQQPGSRDASAAFARPRPVLSVLESDTPPESSAAARLPAPALTKAEAAPTRPNKAPRPPATQPGADSKPIARAQSVVVQSQPKFLRTTAFGATPAPVPARTVSTVATTPRKEPPVASQPPPKRTQSTLQLSTSTSNLSKRKATEPAQTQPAKRAATTAVNQPTPPDPTPDLKYSCPSCHKRFAKESSVKKHRSTRKECRVRYR